MVNITAKEIAEFRAKTGLPMMECKSALVEANGDQEKALEILKKRGVTKALKKAERETKSGLVESYIHAGGQIGVLVEVLSETDFVARNEEFKELVHNIALHIAAANPKYITKGEVLEEDKNKEKASFMEQAKAEGKPENIAEKIVEGKLEKYFEEICLMSQPFVKDPSITIQELINQKISKIGENIVVSRFSRFEIGL